MMHNYVMDRNELVQQVNLSALVILVTYYKQCQSQGKGMGCHLCQNPSFHEDMILDG